MITNEQYEKLEQYLCSIATNMTELRADVSELKSEVSELKSEVASLKSNVDTLSEKVDILQHEMESVKSDISSMNIRLMRLEKQTAELHEISFGIRNTIDFSIAKNISIIAEGHLDLDRKLDEAKEFHKDQELFRIRFNFLEDDVKRFKRYFQAIA